MDKIINILKSNYVIPSVLLKEYKNLNLTEQEVILLIYLMNEKENEFNPQIISKNLNIDLNDVLTLISSLSSKDVLKIEHTIEKGIHKELVNIDQLYNKLAFKICGEKNEKKITIYDKFEKEFGRTLSPMEYEIINVWSSSYSEEIINEALKEAVYNNVNNLRYIDKILSEWNKKGIKSIDDVEKDRKNFNSKNKKELVEYDWLNSNE